MYACSMYVDGLAQTYMYMYTYVCLFVCLAACQCVCVIQLCVGTYVSYVAYVDRYACVYACVRVCTKLALDTQGPGLCLTPRLGLFSFLFRFQVPMATHFF